MPPLKKKWKPISMRIACFALFISLVGLTSGCGSFGFPGVYRVDIEQGNIITQHMVDQLKPGMTRRQVRYILGTPLVEDSFNQSRWDYVYTIRNGTDSVADQRLSVYFEGDELSHFRGNFVPAAADS